ncbi:pentapeptide repeat-containing protein [Nocardia brasiliensis]|uniref:pentapeptide repeat-containing protein n=1 Tax=Nocardia brasiliensis TaxID=37326 RepID=UPI002454E65E|nr:pentapeptide repeat-containing protein [Nocardia brasiliensis]
MFPSVTLALLAGLGVAFAAYGFLRLITPTDTSKPAAELDVTKVALTVVAGVGGVVALVIAYRRQRDLEQSRFVERFGAAAAQLGATDVAVRIAGVYAMAGVADESDGLRRQQCIDVLCGYLRLPYRPELGTNHQSKLVLKHHRATADGTRADDEERHLEYRHNDREVRATIIRVIAAHLRTPAEYSWSASDFDFRTAHLEDVGFSRVTFDGTADFDGVTFDGTADFDAATFSGEIRFNQATFSGAAWFRGAVFSGETRFNHAVFSSEATFSTAIFSSEATFSAATFSGETRFNRAIFSAATWFNNATFSGETRFRDATFSGATRFTYATFSGTTTFVAAAFSGATWFRGAAFSGEVEFGEVDFGCEAISFCQPQTVGSASTGVRLGRGLVSEARQHRTARLATERDNPANTR